MKAGRVNGLIASLPEAVVLTLLAALPAFINIATERIFEEEKALLLRAAALLALPGAVVLLWRQGGRVLRQPVVLVFAALTAALMAAAALGVSPRDAFAGVYLRRHGVATWLSLGLVFLVVSAVARAEDGRRRILQAIAIGSLWPSVYAVLQWSEVDPVGWLGTTPGRSGSTLGNPILLGGYLAVAIPLTVHLAARTVWYRPLVLLQLVALAASGSRGPAIALVAAALVLIVALVWERWRKPWVIGGLVFACVLAGALVVLPATRPSWADAFFEASSGSGRVRVLIWEGIASLMRESGARLWIGYGPESLAHVFPPHYSPEIGRIESADAMPDRAHNELLDVLVSGGVLAVVAQLMFWGAVAAACLRVTEPALRAALLAGVAAHVIEIQLGISTVLSRMLFLCAAAIAVGKLTEAPPPATAKGRATRRSSQPLNVGGPAGRPLRVVPWICMAALAGGVSAILTSPSFNVDASITGGTVDVLIRQLRSMARATPLAYAAVAAAALGLAWALAPRSAGVRYPVLHVALLAGAVMASAPLAIRPSQADVFSRSGNGFESRRQWTEAAVAYREALRVSPREPYYLTGLARVLVQEAAALDSAGRRRGFVEAAAVLEQARTVDPFNSDHPRNLASVLRIEATMAEPAMREERLARADRLYAEATERSPRRPMLWIEWANVDGERRRFAEGLAKLDRAIALDATRREALVLREQLSSLRARVTSGQ
jgi:O-antigen ligase